MTQEQRVAEPPSPQFANQSGAAADTITSAPVPSAPAANELKRAAAKIDAAQAPERWLEDIRKLRVEGNIAEADNQWREFRKTFPDYTVSDDDAARPRPFTNSAALIKSPRRFSGRTERACLYRARFRSDSSARAGNDLIHDDQPETGAVLPLGGEKRLEHVGTCVFVHADAGVRNGDQHISRATSILHDVTLLQTN